MGASQGGTGEGPGGGLAAGDGSDILGDEESKNKNSRLGNALNGAGAGIAKGLASLDQQPQQVAAGPQLGAGVTQAPPPQDPYQAYLLKLQQQNQTPFYGN